MTTPSVDLEAVRRLVPLLTVLRLHYPVYRLRHRRGNWLDTLCPYGCCCNRAICHFNLRWGWFHCHGCNRAGDQLELHAWKMKLDVEAAAIDLCQATGRAVPYLPGHPGSEEGKGNS